MKVDRDKFNFISRVIFCNEWLSDKEEELAFLLFEECIDKNEIDIVCDIMKVFKYIDYKEYTGLLDSLVERIIQDNVVDSNTQVVAMSADANADSSQKILYDLKVKFIQLEWEEHLLVNGFGRSYKSYKKAQKRHVNIFLVDDFIGSGKTALSRVEELGRIYSEEQVVIKVRVLVATEQGLEHLRNNNVDVESIITINRSIDDNFDEFEALRRRQVMKRIEEGLLPIYKGREMPSLGYGGTQSAYYIEASNASNNIFPIFWWPMTSSSRRRKTIFFRSVGDA